MLIYYSLLDKDNLPYVFSGIITTTNWKVIRKKMPKNKILAKKLITWVTWPVTIRRRNFSNIYTAWFVKDVMTVVIRIGNLYYIIVHSCVECWCLRGIRPFDLTWNITVAYLVVRTWHIENWTIFLENFLPKFEFEGGKNVFCSKKWWKWIMRLKIERDLLTEDFKISEFLRFYFKWCWLLQI